MNTSSPYPIYGTLDSKTAKLFEVHYVNPKPALKACVQKLIQAKWEMVMHEKKTRMSHAWFTNEYEHLIRVDAVVIAWFRISHATSTRGMYSLGHIHCYVTTAVFNLSSTIHILLVAELLYEIWEQQ